MKKPVKQAGIVLLICLLPGCASLGGGKDFSAYAPLGLVSVVSNYDINWVGEETVGESGVNDFFRGALNIQVDESKTLISKADTLINDADDLARHILAEAGVFGLADKDRVINAGAYASAGSAEGPGNVEKAIADGYRFVNYRDKKFSSELSRETGMQSFLYLSFDFTKEMTSGIGKNGNCLARVSMFAVVVSAAGKVIYRKTIETQSYDTIPVSRGTYSQDDLMELFKGAVTEACQRFTRDFARPVS